MERRSLLAGVIIIIILFRIIFGCWMNSWRGPWVIKEELSGRMRMIGWMDGHDMLFRGRSEVKKKMKIRVHLRRKKKRLYMSWILFLLQKHYRRWLHLSIYLSIYIYIFILVSFFRSFFFLSFCHQNIYIYSMLFFSLTCLAPPHIFFLPSPL